MSLAKSWIDCCTSVVDEHSRCSAPNEPALPTRIIDVGRGDVEPHLLESGGRIAPYAALSHCWGGTSPITTTKSTVDRFLEKIPYISLPQTFQDAVTVTRKLGLQYLWIDSLCIIQDSVDDWLQESARMASVYENSTVTIAADAADDSTTGFLTHYNDNLGQVSYLDSDGLTKTIYMREKGKRRGRNPYHYSLSNPRKSRNEPDFSSPFYSRLCTRAWTFQELILSPRTLRFAEELAWECRSIMACECTAHSIRSKQGISLLKRKLTDRDWKSLVEEYSRLDLTVPTDRLPALAGLAEALCRVNPDRYICGLWERNFTEQLLWRVKDVSGNTRFDGYIAPSWSWASLSGPVWFDVVHHTPSCRILSVECEYRREGAVFGAVTSARLTMSALLAPVRFKDGAVVSEVKTQAGESCVSDFFVDTWDLLKQVKDGEQYWFLMLAGGPKEETVPRTFMNDRSLPYPERPRGIVIKNSARHDHPNCFERVGFVHDGGSRDYTPYDDSDSDSDSRLEAQRPPRRPASTGSRWEDWKSVAEQKDVVIV